MLFFPIHGHWPKASDHVVHCLKKALQKVRNGQENFDMVPRDRACVRASVRASERASERACHLVASYSARAKLTVSPAKLFLYRFGLLRA